MISSAKKAGMFALGLAGLFVAGSSSNAQAFDLHPHPVPHCHPAPHCFPYHCSPSWGVSFGFGYSPSYRSSVYVSTPVVYSTPVVMADPVIVTSAPVMVDNSEQLEFQRKLALEGAKDRRKDAEKRVEKFQKELRKQDKIEGEALGMKGGDIDNAAPGSIDAAYSAKYGPSEGRQLIERYLNEAVNDLGRANADIVKLSN